MFLREEMRNMEESWDKRKKKEEECNVGDAGEEKT